IIAPVSGNHETGKYQFSSRFNLKNVDTDDGISGNYYSFSYNEAYFLCLNTNDTLNPTDPDTCTGLSDNQLNFIKSDLEKNKNAKWKFVLLHKGLFDPGEHSSNKQYEEGTYHDYDIDKIRKQLVPLFDQYNVDVVLQGHDHLYSRTLPTIAKNNGYSVGEYAEEIVNHNGKEYKTKYVTNGTIYCNTSTASGSKYYNVTTYDENMMHFEIAKGMTPRMYTNYEVDGDYLFVDSYEIDAFGEEKVYESWALTKNEIKNDQPIDDGNEEENNDKSSNIGLIVGLTISGVVIIGIAVALTIIFIKKKKGK
ncbi:MAG: metallophosphoesterase, partial [Bacilli bacterium]|nr:metallophosphoesterase [Bacilli bacterium]MDY5832092.1 metallophosphoesterase [Candidatus Onthovivens sp.]